MEMNIGGYEALANLNSAQRFVVGSRRNTVVDAGIPVGELGRFKYARFELQNERISKECALRLQALGVECLTEGREYEAYGIVIDDEVIRQLMLRDPEIFAVEDEEPPAGK